LDNLAKIYKEVSEDLGLSKGLVESIAEAQFSFVVKTMREKNLNDIRLQFLGAFKVKPGRLKHLGQKGKELIKSKTDEYNSLL